MALYLLRTSEPCRLKLEVEKIDETLKLLAHARDLAERIKARDVEQARDREHLEHVLRRLSSMAGSSFQQGFQVELPVRAFQQPREAEEASNAARSRGFTLTVLPRTPTGASPDVPEPPVEEVSKYDLILHLIASGRFDIGMAARALYNEDSERARNRVRAGVNHLRERGLVERHPNGTLTAIRRRPIPGSEAPAEKREGEVRTRST